MKIINKPFYEAEIKTSGCAVELLINDVLCFSHYEEGGMAVDWPINEFILESGRQLFSIRAICYKGEEKINDNALLSLKIFVRDAFFNEAPRQLVFELPFINFKEKTAQHYTYGLFFEAKVPYKLEGWKNSRSLVQEDTDKLLRELSVWYNRFFEIFINEDETEYLKITKNRFDELSEVFYLDKASKESNKSRMFSSIHSSVKKVSFNKYRLHFYGNGKLVGLKLPKEPCGFKFQSLVKGKPSFTELVLFHRKKENGLLEIIR